MRSLPKLRNVDMIPVRAASVPSAARATREAIAHIGGAPVPQNWDIDRPRIAS